MCARILVAGLSLAAVAAMGASSPDRSEPKGDKVVARASLRPAQASAPDSGNEACASCHAEIYSSYAKTVMAKASGSARDGFLAGEFTHKASGVSYRVFERDAKGGILPPLPLDSNRTVWMSYQRSGERDFGGERELSYFIGSGVKGRTYLFSTGPFWFEAPINWYAQEGRWNMAPAYTEAREMPMTLPALMDCLNCHASGLRAPVAGTENRFAGPPFLHGGITCERCHGRGEGHGQARAQLSSSLPPSPSSSASSSVSSSISPSRSSAIVNPAKLDPERRDAICMECHFEGSVAVEQPGRHVYQFQPGERLADYIHYFLLIGTGASDAQALSQFEALSLSACKRKSGDKMWCGSCHDAHGEPDRTERVAYYRSKCLACHGEPFAAKHHPDKPDCTACHMPALPSKDVAHTEATDHRLRKYPHAPQLHDAGPVRAARLEPFPGSEASTVTTRDFALAWQTLAGRNDGGASRQAERYLRQAAEESPDDAVVLVALAFVELQGGREDRARELYERALEIDPLNNDAATNLGALEAKAGNVRRAVQLWQGAFERAPYRSAIGMNLAIAFCAAEQKEDARTYVKRVLEFNPDEAKAKSLRAHMDRDPVECRP